MKIPSEKLAALLGSALLTVTLSACGAGGDDSHPGSDEVEHQDDDGGGYGY